MDLKYGITYKPLFYHTQIKPFASLGNDIPEHLLNLPYLEVTEARKEYFMSDFSREYTYGSGNGIRTYKSELFDNEVNLIRIKINEVTNTQYDICFINRYDSQQNWLGWHADDGKEMDPKHPIAVMSFGAEREIWWKLKTEKGQIPSDQRALLGHGSLFIMPIGFQEAFYHKIPKCDRECGIRISLTFRKWK